MFLTNTRIYTSYCLENDDDDSYLAAVDDGCSACVANDLHLDCISHISEAKLVSASPGFEKQRRRDMLRAFRWSGFRL